MQRILIVDDEDDIREFIGYNLRREGYDISTASNGKEAIEIACTTLPHLILLDMMMPVMDDHLSLRRTRGAMPDRQLHGRCRRLHY